MFCCALPCVHSSFAIILMVKRELVALLFLSSWCLVGVVWLFHTVPRACLQFVILIFPDNTHLLFLVDMAQGTEAKCVSIFGFNIFYFSFDMQNIYIHTILIYRIGMEA